MTNSFVTEFIETFRIHFNTWSSVILFLKSRKPRENFTSNLVIIVLLSIWQNTQNWQYCHYCQVCILMNLQFSSLLFHTYHQWAKTDASFWNVHMGLHHCQFFMQKLRTRIVGDLAERLTSMHLDLRLAAHKLSMIGKQWTENFRHYFKLNFTNVFVFNFYKE